MLTHGMDYLDVQAATALMRAKFELCLFEIYLITNRDTTNECLIRNPQIIWTYISPLWKNHDKFRKPREEPVLSTPLTTGGRPGKRISRLNLSRVMEGTEEPWNPNLFTPQAPTEIQFTGVRGNTYAGSGILQTGRMGASLFRPTFGEPASSKTADLLWDESEPIASSTPQKGKARVASPPLSDQSANSRTFRVQTPNPINTTRLGTTTPPLQRDYERTFGRSSQPSGTPRGTFTATTSRPRKSRQSYLPRDEDSEDEEEDIHQTTQMTKEMEDLPEEEDWEEVDQEEVDQEEEDCQITTPSIDYSVEDSLTQEDRSEDNHSTSQNTISIQNSRSLTFQPGMAMSIPYFCGSRP